MIGLMKKIEENFFKHRFLLRVEPGKMRGECDFADAVQKGTPCATRFLIHNLLVNKPKLCKYNFKLISPDNYFDWNHVIIWPNTRISMAKNGMM